MRLLPGCWIVGLGVVSCLAEPAQATVENFGSFKQAYPKKPVTCRTCHENPVGRKDDLNAYGKALKQLAPPANSKKLRTEDYRAVESADSDGDSVSNLKEIEAGTAPGVGAAAGAAAPGTDCQKTSLAPQERRKILLAILDRWAPPSEAWAEPARVGEAQVRAEYVGSETCAACHSDVANRHQRSPHARVGAGQGPSGLDISCESCHGPGSLHASAGGGRGVGGLINPSENPETCYACHTDKRMEFALQYHHPVPEGRMSCTDCHAPHGETPTPRSARAQSETCLKCHEQVKGPWVFEHLAMRDGCLACHQPHGSITTRLLAERDFNLCLKCHFSASQFQRIGHYAHRRATNVSGMEGANCTGCHRAVHGSNFSKELRTQ